MSSGKAWALKIISLFVIGMQIWVIQQTVSLEVGANSEEFCRASTSDYSDFIGHYTFPTTPITTHECNSKDALEKMKTGVSDVSF